MKLSLKYYLKKYGFLNILLLLFKHTFSRFILLFKKLYNTWIECTSNNYIIIRSSLAKPLFSNNWGDYVSTILIQNLSPNKKIINYSESWNIKNRENYLCIGSIISWMTTKSSIIWGSGVVYPDDIISAKPIKVLAVRGPLTREYLLKNGIDCPKIYGDPALLFPRIYTPKFTEKKYKFGIIPHFRDKNSPYLSNFSNSKDIIIIDVQNVKNWKLFIDHINQCKYILSSSLHGIIVADAYKTPNIWVEFKNGENKRFAFNDYFLSVSRSLQSPFLIDENVNFIAIEENILRNWTPPKIDLEKLLSVYPFK